MKFLSVLLAAALAILCSACAAGTPTPAATAEPPRAVELLILPRTLHQGMRATMVGQGFDGNEPVAFYLIRPDGSKTSEGNSTADKDGGAAYELDLTDDWQPGHYIARVKSRTHPARAAEINFELGPR